MKTTGLSLVFLAMCILVFCALVAVGADIKTSGNENHLLALPGPILTIPLVTAAVIGVLGTAMYFIGGRGFYVIRRPPVQSVDGNGNSHTVRSIEKASRERTAMLPH
jgi:hypothetical protein